ncbi:hypothetical protein SLEP1_g41723 [Rubroshorea leprosula]|uniref:Uncharacterized protein n=1 Tax=Rubroshorea leprosula TaxID=152421 RepID=A0AAV5L7F9_9ROSI|nr:hypothetical protein SLEP1_g41723 [Rubroshorea leprosula]
MLAQSAGVQATWVRRRRRQGDLVQQRIRLFGRSRSAGVAECKARACRSAGAQARCSRGRRERKSGSDRGCGLGAAGAQGRKGESAGAGRRLVRGKKTD